MSGEILAGSAIVNIALNDRHLQEGLSKAQSNLQRFAARAGMFASGMSTLGAGMGAMLLPATKTFADFDMQMRTAQAVSGATAREFANLTAQAKELGATTSFTAGQVAAGMTALGRMGFKADEIKNATPAVMDLAKATGTEMAQAAEIAANNLRVFELEAQQMGGAADIMTATVNLLSVTANGAKLSAYPQFGVRAGAHQSED